jgi:hypothetical protein
MNTNIEETPEIEEQETLYHVPDGVDPADDPEAMHLNGLADQMGLIEDAEDVAALVEDAEDLMTEAAFCALFKDIWEIPAMFTKGLEGLRVTEDKRDACDMAGKSIHWLLKRHAPRVLSTENDTFSHVAMAAPFLLMQGGVARAYFQDRKEERRARLEMERRAFFQTKREIAANEDRPPVDMDQEREGAA